MAKDVPVRRTGGGLTAMRDEMNRLFDRFSGSHWPHVGRRRAETWPDVLGQDPFAGLDWPATRSTLGELGRADLSETDSGYELEVDLPGMSRDDISVDFSDGMVSISGERSDEREDQRKGYYLSERSYGSVKRMFRVPESVKTDEIKAEFRDGVLTLRMPKTEEAQKSTRRIDIE
ncbi:MAG: Hsp20/alpha crystallin family protein [Halofilum sp. (in: g-proteobacteria)]|nr:Hsp20/alpha crystallin family protein [Halofilum sp. (in: g-proteobacteria)]